jgi:hypothetical protein
MLTQFNANFNFAPGTLFDASKKMTKRQFERIFFQGVMDVRYPKQPANQWNDQQQLLKVKGHALSQDKFQAVLNEIRGVTNSVWNTTPITENLFDKVLEKMKEFKDED